jgi:DNA-binding SARP family transcriptional activator
MSVFIRLLGPIDICHDDAVMAIGAPKRRAMLAMLALGANRPVTLPALVDTLWGDAAPPSALKNLRTHAHALRSLVDGRLVTRPGAYELQLNTDELDATLFVSLADRGAAALAAGDPSGAVAAHGEALALWRDASLPGMPHAGGLDATLTGLSERRLAVFESYCDARLATGSTSELIPALRRHLGVHPFRERAWAALMLAQYRSGDLEASLSSFGHAEAILREQLGVDPGRELVDLRQAILARDPRLDLPRFPFSPTRVERLRRR